MSMYDDYHFQSAVDTLKSLSFDELARIIMAEVTNIEQARDVVKHVMAEVEQIEKIKTLLREKKRK